MLIPGGGMSRIHNKRSERGGINGGEKRNKHRQGQPGGAERNVQQNVSQRVERGGGEITARTQHLSGTASVSVSRTTNWVFKSLLVSPSERPRGEIKPRIWPDFLSFFRRNEVKTINRSRINRAKGQNLPSTGRRDFVTS